ncbi:MAG: cobyric acid synthase [Oscillospiraceae bacterium]|nr:cobyric acid synthase [Oscillospiraceae bacterium]
MAKSIMIQGTSSGVGKTIITMALCRILKQDGYNAAPFKSQNITSNTAFVNDGGEIAVSQLLQARAAKTEPNTDMNPVILKMSSEKNGTQVILNGKPYGKINAYNFKEIKRDLIPEITKAYDNLSKRYDIIVLEGAGSPVELNLNKNDDDIVNMGIAKRVKSPVLLVSDIDRGGVFASLYGTVNLLDKSERKYVKATVVNRFRGDISYFKDGVDILENITGVPVAGVVPYFKFDIPEEDSLYTNDISSNGDFDAQFDLIADHARKSLDMELIYRIINGGMGENYG